MHLTVDAGNTNVKYAIFEGNTLRVSETLMNTEPANELRKILRQHGVEKSILSSVRASADELLEVLNEQTQTTLMDSALRFPFEIAYETPETLGHDRLANAAGAAKLFPGKNVLILDCGTCLTYTLLKEGKLIGGTIAPGINLRFEALHRFTGKLPYIQDAIMPVELPGKNTRDSLISGVLNAIIAETDSMIQNYCSISDDLNVILTGGNRPFFEKYLKSPIFAVPYLTHEGLHEILLLNQ